MRIGVDIGGTKIEAAVLDVSGNIILRRRLPTPKLSYRKFIEKISEFVLSIEHEMGEQGSLGFGIPGVISPDTGLVKNAYNSPTNGHPLDKDLAEIFRRPVRLMNDANCFALSESTGGAGKDGKVIFGAILGSGCGAGIVIDGNILIGKNSICGEWGHNPLPWPDKSELLGLKCDCGKYGCIETYISGTGLSRQYETMSDRFEHAETIVTLSNNGEIEAKLSLKLFENRLARAFASIINVLDPDVIVIGGGMSNVPRLYKNIPKIWSNWIYSNHVSTALRSPVFGDSSGVRGAAWLWPEHKTL